MDRRSWLWRRKSSEKSPSGETESSGSVSSFSERFSDDQVLPNHKVQSPEVTSKPAKGDELVHTVKTLSDKLSEAFLNIRAKEDLVKQHSKVAEEAVSGWEKAEKEALALKKQKDSLTQKNVSLEERVDHLDGALKECLRQLRQTREEQEDEIAEKSKEWETNKSQLENQLADFRAQLNLYKTDTILSKLETSEKENSNLKLRLLEKDEELKLRTTERDMNASAAESASRQHLESIRKVSKLEAECRKLKAMARKASNDYRSSVTLSSIGAESFTDSQSLDSETELGNFNKNEKTMLEKSRAFGPSLEIGLDLMDDFLEMERLAAIPDTRKMADGQEEMEAMVKRTVELEESLRKVTEEKAALETALNECQIQLSTTSDQLNQTTSKLVDMNMQLAAGDEEKRELQREVDSMKVKLENSAKLLGEGELTVAQIQDQLAKANEAKRRVEAKLEDADFKRTDAESRLSLMENELETLRSEIFTLEREVERERSFSREAAGKCKTLESEMERMKSVSKEFQRSEILEEFRISKDEELGVAARKFAECQKTIASIGNQLKSLTRFEDFVIETESPVAVV